MRHYYSDLHTQSHHYAQTNFSANAAHLVALYHGALELGEGGQMRLQLFLECPVCLIKLVIDGLLASYLLPQHLIVLHNQLHLLLNTIG